MSRALDWLLANPSEAAAAGLPARPVIYTMGFDEALVLLAMAQADGSEERAINLLLNGEVNDTAPAAPASTAAAAVADDRLIFTMGFDAELVRRALRQARNREADAVELLLAGEVNEDAGDEDEDENDEGDAEGDGAVPSAWEGSPEEFENAMDMSIHHYMQ